MHLGPKIVISRGTGSSNPSPSSGEARANSATAAHTRHAPTCPIFVAAGETKHGYRRRSLSPRRHVGRGALNVARDRVFPMEWADRALHEFPDSVFALRSKAIGLIQLGRTEEARTSVKRLLELRPGLTIAECRAALTIRTIGPPCTRGQECHLDDSDRLRGRHRPGRRRTRREPRPAGSPPRRTWLASLALRDCGAAGPV